MLWNMTYESFSYDLILYHYIIDHLFNKIWFPIDERNDYLFLVLGWFSLEYITAILTVGWMRENEIKEYAPIIVPNYK